MVLQFGKEETNFLMMEFRKGGRYFLAGSIQDFQDYAQASNRKVGIKIMSASVFLVFLDETGSKFWFLNTCEKVKSDY